MKQITPRQCKQARSLLKWNLQDLANKSKLPPKTIERFEKSMGRLTMPEMDSISTTFKKEGVIFLDNMDVILSKEGADAKQNQDGQHMTGALEQKTYEVTYEDLQHGPQHDLQAQQRKQTDPANRKPTHQPTGRGETH